MKKSELLFIVLSALILSGCKTDQPEFWTSTNTFTFAESEQNVVVDNETTSFTLQGSVTESGSLTVIINVVSDESTAIPGEHYIEPKTIYMFFPDEKEQTIVFEIMPENITEEVQITFETSSQVKIMGGGISKTVVKLIPVNP